MDEKRLILAIVLSVIVFVIWQFFFVDKEVLKKSAQKQPTTPVTKEEPVSEEPYVKEKKDRKSDSVTINLPPNLKE